MLCEITRSPIYLDVWVANPVLDSPPAVPLVFPAQRMRNALAKQAQQVNARVALAVASLLIMQLRSASTGVIRFLGTRSVGYYGQIIENKRGRRKSPRRPGSKTPLSHIRPDSSTCWVAPIGFYPTGWVSYHLRGLRHPRLSGSVHRSMPTNVTSWRSR